MSEEVLVFPKKLQKVLKSARLLLSGKEYAKSLSHFAYIVHSFPFYSHLVHDDFEYALKAWCSVLLSHNKTEDMVKCCDEACRLFPLSGRIANIAGSALFQADLIDQAATLFRQALKLDPTLISAEESLESIANLLVERWHFRMLNDSQRNYAYKKAITRAVERGCKSVLDIGSGTCILSMFAVQAGAVEVHACEMSHALYNMSLDLLSANEMKDFVHVINKKSHDLLIPTDINKKVSLIVTETLDCGLLGEGIISTLAHAKQHLLDMSQKGSCPSQVIPEAATVYGQVIECEKIQNYSRLKPGVYCEGISNIRIRGAEVSKKGLEPYTTEDMSCLKHKCLSKPFVLGRYNFYTPEDYLEEMNDNVSIPIVECGTVDAIMTWFELRLDAQEVLSSAPGQSVCWEQAIYPCHPPEGMQPIFKVGDEVNLNVRLTSSAIYLEVNSVVQSQENTLIQEKNCPHNMPTKLDINLSTAHSPFLMPVAANAGADKELFETHDIRHCSIFYFPHQDISKLNDTFLQEMCELALQKTLQDLKKTSSRNGSNFGCITSCLSPSLSPLLALTTGYSPVMCITQNSRFSPCLKVLARESKFEEKLILTNDPLENFANSKRFHVFIVDPIEPGGQLRQGVIEDIVFAKGCVLHKDLGRVLPNKIEIWGMLVQSSELCQKTCVIGDDVTLGLNIAGFMNTFQVKNQIDVDVESNPFVAHTNPTKLLTFDIMNARDDDAMLSLLSLSSDVPITASDDGVIDGLMYWFELDYGLEKMLSTGPSTSNHFNQVVVMFKEKISIHCGQKLMVKASCQKSCINIIVL